MMKKIALITGASAGLGKAFLRHVNHYYPQVEEVWLIARRADLLEALAKQHPNARTVPLDLTAPDAFTQLANRLSDANAQVDLVINNAGMGTLGEFAHADSARQAAQIDLNCRALTLMSRTVLPFMARGSAILNVCSIAAFAPTPGMSVYCATKAYVFAFSKSLHRELKKQGISVTAVCPGPMHTEFLDLAGITGNSKAFAALPYCDPDSVADGALHAVKKGRMVYTPRLFYKFYRVLAKLLPHGLVMWFSKT